MKRVAVVGFGFMGMTHTLNILKNADLQRRGCTFRNCLDDAVLAQHQAALKMIQEGKLGKPVYGRAQLSCWYPPIEGAWRQDPKVGGGGSLMDMSSHCIDLSEMFFGKVKSVSCIINNIVHSYKSEDSSVVSLLFESEALATVDSYFSIPDNSSKNILELSGSKGSILAKDTIGQRAAGEMITYLEDDANQVRIACEGVIINPTPVNTYLAEIEEFSRSIPESRELLNNAAIGMECQKILATCYLLAKTEKTVAV